MSSAHAFQLRQHQDLADLGLPRFAWIVLGYNVAVVLWGRCAATAPAPVAAIIGRCATGS